MARIRTIKPEFFTSETIAGLQLLSRLTFIGLWTACDDAGRCQANTKLIKAALFPLEDKITADVVGRCLDELADAGLVEMYQSGADGRVWLQVSSWDEHQIINRPSKVRSPAAGEDDPSVRLHGACSEPSVRTHPGKGKERNREQGKERKDAAIVFEHWKTVMRKRDSVSLDLNRSKRIAWALDSYPIEDILDAIDGCAATPWNMGDNPGRKRYDDLTLILRDATHLERYRDAKRGSELAPRTPRNAAERQTAQLDELDRWLDENNLADARLVQAPKPLEILP